LGAGGLEFESPRPDQLLPQNQIASASRYSSDREGLEFEFPHSLYVAMTRP